MGCNGSKSGNFRVFFNEKGILLWNDDAKRGMESSKLEIDKVWGCCFFIWSESALEMY